MVYSYWNTLARLQNLLNLKLRNLYLNANEFSYIMYCTNAWIASKMLSFMTRCDVKSSLITRWKAEHGDNNVKTSNCSTMKSCFGNTFITPRYYN